MGIILSYFFPQLTQARIEHVVVVLQDEDTTQEASEVPVDSVAEDLGVIDDAKPENLVSIRMCE